jgi:hypothetical protein
MNPAKQRYLAYWKQLKLFVEDRGLDWKFSSFAGDSEWVVRIGSPKQKICLSLNAPDGRNPRPTISAGFWIPDSRADFARLKARRVEIESAMGQPLQWDSRPGRKSAWVRVAVNRDLADEKDWPASFEWFAEYAGRIRDVCHKSL